MIFCRHFQSLLSGVSHLRWEIVLFMCGFWLGVGNVAYAQRSSDRGDRREGLFDMEGAIRRYDANGDGRIEPGEIPYRARRFVDHAASEAGFDSKGPIPVEKLVEAIRKQSGLRGSEQGGGKRDEASAVRESTDSAAPRAKAEGTSGSSFNASPPKVESKGVEPPVKSTSQVPGFGELDSSKKPPGFGGISAADAGNMASGKPVRLSQGFEGSAASEGSKAADLGKFRRYAESLMRQYDDNKNGVLERVEWQRMRGDPKAADMNHDDVLSLDELTAKLSRYSANGGNETTSEPTTQASPLPTGSTGLVRSEGRGAEVRPPVRFLSPLERLPKGLPDWFARNDANGDGQIAMSEFTSAWSRERAEEFARYDINLDGFLSPAEALAGEKKKTAK